MPKKIVEKGIARIVLSELTAEGNALFYDSSFVTYDEAISILSKYKDCVDSNSVFDMVLANKVHVWLPVNQIKSAIYLPKSFLKENNE